MAQSNELSNREWEVANLVLEGKSNKAIAAALHISERTVEFHLKNIYVKVQVGSRAEFIVKLGKSTVAGQGKLEENRDSSNSGDWAASLKQAVFSSFKELKMKSLSFESAANGETPMTFLGSILVCFNKYAEFNGRASRPEFWWFALFVTLVASALTYLSQALASVFLIATLLPFLAVGARRLHDIGKNAWWLLYLLLPVGGLVLLGFLWAQPAINPQPEDSLPA